MLLRLVLANSSANALIRATCSACFVIYSIGIWSFREETAFFIKELRI